MVFGYSLNVWAGLIVNFEVIGLSKESPEGSIPGTHCTKRGNDKEDKKYFVVVDTTLLHIDNNINNNTLYFQACQTHTITSLTRNRT